MVKKVICPPTKQDSAKGRWLFDSADFVFPKGFKAVRQAFVGIKPGGWAANHKHKRYEVLLGLAGDLYLIWQDEDGQRHEEKMLSDDGNMQFFFIPSWTPHLVENRSGTIPAVLYEWSDIVDEAQLLEGEESLLVSHD